MVALRRRMLIAGGATLASVGGARKPRAAGSVPAFAGATPGEPVPNVVWKLADGTVRAVEDYAGQGVVLNLWATWCVPCVEEMPALDALSGQLAGAGVVVLPLSSDRGGAAAVERFYRERGIRHLPVLLDPTGNAARTLGARGIPTTVLIDKAGHERGRVEGGADWGSATAVAMVKMLAA